jgi:hypothetical protein
MGIPATMPSLAGALSRWVAILGLRYFGVKYLAMFDTLQAGISPAACIFLIASAREHWCSIRISATRSASAIFSINVYTGGRPLPFLEPPRGAVGFWGLLVVLFFLTTVFLML